MKQMLFSLVLLHLTIAAPQLNLHHTNWVDGSTSESDNTIQHNCLHILEQVESESSYGDRRTSRRRIVTYCLSELPSQFNVQDSDTSSKFTFAQLSQRNITSEDLYLWSAPIDIIEDYQLYLNHLSTSNHSVLAKNIYYNCTIPRFGPKCQYELPYFHSNYSSLNEIIHYVYKFYPSYSNNLTCYIHLQCNRGPQSVCLDWTEICNGKIDCLGNGIDEENCWQLEINDCKDNEFRCRDGQCIPRLLYGFEDTIPSCIDGLDVKNKISFNRPMCESSKEPSVQCEDTICEAYLSPVFSASTCNEQRDNVVIESMHLNNDNDISEQCWTAFKCLIVFQRPEYTNCDMMCTRNNCKKTVMNTCPNIIFFPNIPVLFGNIYFAYKKDDIQNRTNDFYDIPLYICYNTTQYNSYFVNITKMFMNSMTCVHSEPFIPSSVKSKRPVKQFHIDFIYTLYDLLKEYHLPFNYTPAFCNRSNMYQCLDSSKCISIYRLMDNVTDCPHKDDENMNIINNHTNIMKQLDKLYFKCIEQNKYIHQSLVLNENCDCNDDPSGLCEDEILHLMYLRRDVSFQNICDRSFDLLPKLYGERIETDETECEQWSCHNVYTHCDHRWNCVDGADEIACQSHQTIHCSSKHHLCVIPDTNQFICLPIEKINDGHVDCLGATDEHTLCANKNSQVIFYSNTFYCMNDSSQSCVSVTDLCDNHEHCQYGDDEQFCSTNRTMKEDISICRSHELMHFDVAEFLCSFTKSKSTEASIFKPIHNIIPFKLHQIIESNKDQIINTTQTLMSSMQSYMIKTFDQRQFRCHHGLDLRIWLNDKNNSTKSTCLCSPQYYGHQCQYQKQRISLDIRFQALSDSWRTLFAVVISLIDDSDQRVIHSYECINYLTQIDCQRISHIYLFYSTRPKNPLNKYAIHIDVFDKETLSYRGSLLYPVSFTFLPVHRLVFIVNIPSVNHNKTHECFNDRCIHGQCIRYYNNSQNLTFCRCEKGWSGKYCTIQHTCTCSLDSLCIGISPNNRSICVCPSNKFGPRCLLTDTICNRTNNATNSTCQNGGKCIPTDGGLGFDNDFGCICPKGYSGKRCEIIDSRLSLSFDKNMALSEEIFIHFFEINNRVHFNPHLQFPQTPIRTTTFQTISLEQDTVTIYWSKPFHLVFIELFHKIYYLILIQNTFINSTIINKTIHSSDRCPNITELFNNTFLQWPLIRRIKYYHLPCQNQSLNLSCFHDEHHLCLCYDFYQQRLANCFRFDHNMTFDCLGRSECENDAQCLQDDPTCAKKSLCICKPCFYGSRCQFRTSGFGLSLDAILGYQIIPNSNLNQQRFIIKLSFALTIIFIMLGFINSILCIITFKNKIVCEVGCGLYLLGSSITTLFTMIMFGLKFFILIFTQMSFILNRPFLQVQCYLFDYLLRICLSTNQWLDACIATERMFTLIKAARFDKKKSKRTAKFSIIIVLISIGVSLIHDPLHRDLIDEENDYDNIKRTWCVVRYPPGLKVYDSFIHSFHFFGPCLINLISSIVLITRKSRQQLTIHRKQSYKVILRKQIREHKHLLTGPIVLFILALPRLIITFLSNCMKSTHDVWLFLIGYFISFIPPMLTFLLFVIPSKFYKRQFRKTIARYRATVRRHLPFTS